MKPENRFIKRVHDALHPDVYREKMFNPLRGGTPDVYYEGPVAFWTEYKWMPKFSAHIDVSPRPKGGTGRLTGLQMNWLVRSWDNKQCPWVVVGSPTGCVVLTDPSQWQKGISRDEAQVLSVQELARRIERKCGLEFSPKQQPAARRSTRSSSSQP